SNRQRRCQAGRGNRAESLSGRRGPPLAASPRVLRRLAVLAPLLALVLAACDEPPPAGPGVCSIEEDRTFPLWQTPALDILVVLDRTPSMNNHEADLQRLAETTHAVLTTIEGGLPDAHL